MESLIAQANAIGPPKKSKKISKPQNSDNDTKDTHDATLTSIAAHTRIPKSLSNAEEGDPTEKKRKEKKGKYGYIPDLKLRAHLHRMEEGKKDWKEAMEDVQMLNVGTQGGMEVEGKLERTWKITQDEIVSAGIGLDDAKARMEWKLDGGSYQCRFTRSGRHLAIAGRKGHVATFDWQTGKIHAELQLKETCRDITFLQDHTLFAVAQSKHAYMYDLNGVELHRLQHHIEPTQLEYLPYHWLLASIGNTGYLKYQDISTGQLVAQHRTRLGPCSAMSQNPQNAVIQLGHHNGTVTFWTPNSPTPHIRLLAHMGEVTDVEVDAHSGGRYIATSGVDGRVKVWDCRNWKGCVRQWMARSNSGLTGAHLSWSQMGMLAVGSSNCVNVFRKPAITSNHTPLAMPPLYITHPIPRAQVACVKFIPHRDLLTIGHANGLSTIIVPGASNPHYDTAEGGDPYEGKKGRREREVRGLLEKLEPSTIVMDPDLLGGVAEEGKVPDVVHRKLPRLERLRQTGKADETGIAVAAEEAEAGSNDEQDGIIDEDAPKSLREKRQKSKMRGRDKSMKRYLKKKRKNVIDQATVAIRAKLEKQNEEIQKAKESAARKAAGQPEASEKRSALDRFKM